MGCMKYELTLRELRLFLLYKQGLLGDYRFAGKDGALAYVRQAGCIQYDPIDICGRNAELTLHSRVKGVKKEDLYDLLYRDHALVDYTDKEQSILPAEDWPYLERWRETARRSGQRFAGVAELTDQALAYIAEHGAVSADELPIQGAIRWNSAIHWSGNWHGESKAARSVLEQLYSEGRLIIHHRVGTRRYYDLAERHIPQEILRAPDPNRETAEHIKWGICRRIGAMGVLWDRRSDSLLGIWGMDTPQRRRAFAELAEAETILPLEARETGEIFYMLASDVPLLDAALSARTLKRRCEFIAPLDPLLWDRNMVEAIFGFRYRWEIYTPAAKRQYGYYVLPMIWGDGFAGRVEAAADRSNGVLRVKNVWLEPGVPMTRLLADKTDGAFRRLARFNRCRSVERADTV